MANRPRAMKRQLRAQFITGEVPTGSGDTFTLAHTPRTGTLQFSVNGMILTDGAISGGYTRSGVTITTTETYDADAEPLANYQKTEGT